MYGYSGNQPELPHQSSGPLLATPTHCSKTYPFFAIDRYWPVSQRPHVGVRNGAQPTDRAASDTMVNQNNSVPASTATSRPVTDLGV